MRHLRMNDIQPQINPLLGQLVTVVLGLNSALYYVNLTYNRLSDLNVSQNSALYRLYINNNVLFI